MFPCQDLQCVYNSLSPLSGQLLGIRHLPACSCYHGDCTKESSLSNVLTTDSEHQRHNSYQFSSPDKVYFPKLDHSTKKKKIKIMTKITSNIHGDEIYIIHHPSTRPLHPKILLTLQVQIKCYSLYKLSCVSSV